ncbi:MAG: PQQ-binding-like beta-propeller repeat protein [Planctomycetota bacterium]|nr:PQQ-binding-like beta-propeller repeat protein [Planctomycetota bacterium]
MTIRSACFRLSAPVALACAAWSTLPVLANDWTNTGGNARRNGLSSVLGPDAATLLWSRPEFSIIAWAPVSADGRVYVIKEFGFPTNGGAANDDVVAYDQETGLQLWRRSLPFGGDTTRDWIAWIAGARDGKVYASRSGNGASVSQVMYALDGATGNTVWTSASPTAAGSYDGVVFAPDGDLVVADFRNITRINSTDGSTVWRVPRLGSVSGNCGGAATDTAIFIVDASPMGNVIKKFDLETGQFLYQSSPMAGFTTQNSPFLSPDGTSVYFARSQNNQPVDNFYAFTDTGTALVERWNRPVKWTTSHEHGIGPDGSIYTVIPGEAVGADDFVRLDPATGAVLNVAPAVLPPRPPPTAVNLSPKTAVDASGIVYLSNGWASSPATNGRLWAFPADLSSVLFTLTLDRQNNGGPILTSNGALVVADRQGVRAYKTNRCRADFNNDGQVDFFDYLDFSQAFAAEDPSADFNDDGQVDFFDYLDFAEAFGAGCD